MKWVSSFSRNQPDHRAKPAPEQDLNVVASEGSLRARRPETRWLDSPDDGARPSHLRTARRGSLRAHQGHATIAGLRTELQRHFGADLATIPEGSSLAQDAGLILDWAERKAPRTLIALLEERAPFNVAIDRVLRDYRSRIEAVEAAPNDPFREILLWKRTVFLDRAGLRKRLRDLAFSDRPSTLLVQGPAGSGKTKTADLVEYCAGARGEESVVVEAVGQLEIHEVVEQLLFGIPGQDGIVDTVETPDSHWYREQCRRLVRAVLDTDKVWWLVLDDLGQSSEAVELVEHLAKAIARGRPARSIRLVLLDYPRSEAPQGVADGAIEWNRLRYGLIDEGQVRD